MSQLKFWNKQSNNSSNNNNSNSNSKDNHNNSNSSNSNGGQTNDASNNSNSSSSTKADKRNWLHSPDALINGHIAYLVKFFGNLPVDQPKGTEVVKDVIRKLQFAQQLKKHETGTQEKLRKVEITISIDGVAVQEPRTQKILHQFPLHNISYCMDEKGVKKFFSFIAKTVKPIEGNGHAANGGTGNNTTNGMSSGSGGGSISASSNGSVTGGSNTEETHECFVFISSKLASDITLTIGQAFDLAYKKFISTTEKTELGKAQDKIVELEKAVAIYRSRLREISLRIPRAELETLLFQMGVPDILEIPSNKSSGTTDNGHALTNGHGNNSTGNGGKLVAEDKLLIDTNSHPSSLKMNTNALSSSSGPFVPMVPPRNNLSSQILHKSNSQKMDELLLNSDSDSDFDPRAEEALDGVNGGKDDFFGFEPSKSYGAQLFPTTNTTTTTTNNNDSKLQNQNSNSSGHSFTNEMNVTPPLLAPPPKVASPRRTTTTSVSTANSNANHTTNGTTDLFGSDPFDVSGPSIFKSKLHPVSVDDFSLESLDPLRK